MQAADYRSSPPIVTAADFDTFIELVESNQEDHSRMLQSIETSGKLIDKMGQQITQCTHSLINRVRMLEQGSTGAQFQTTSPLNFLQSSQYVPLQSKPLENVLTALGTGNKSQKQSLPYPSVSAFSQAIHHEVCTQDIPDESLKMEIDGISENELQAPQKTTLSVKYRKQIHWEGIGQWVDRYLLPQLQEHPDSKIHKKIIVQAYIHDHPSTTFPASHIQMGISIALKRIFPDLQTNKKYYVGMRYRLTGAATEATDEVEVKMEGDNDS